MKYSMFNSIVQHDNGFALYNSFGQNVIFLDPDLKDILHAAILEGVDKLAAVHPEFYQYLIEHNYLVENTVDEYEKLKMKSKQVDENLSEFLLTINPTMNCNFKCWYCYESHVKDSKMEHTVLDSTKLFIKKQFESESLQALRLSFFGGEPLLYFSKNVIPLVDSLQENAILNNKDYDVSFTTNGFLIDDAFIDYFKSKAIKPSFQITLDGNAEDHDKVRFVSKTRGSYYKIIENVRKLLLEGGFPVSLRINYTDENLSKCIEIIDEFNDLTDEIKKNLFIIDFHRVWQNIKIDNTSKTLVDHIKTMEDQGFRCNYTYSANNVINSCYADKRQSAVINYNGDLYKCTARDFTSKNRSGYLNEKGELIWDDGYIEKRMDSKFKNKPCFTCRISPLCNGGCSQHAMEHIEDYCIYQGDESEKDKVVEAKIQELIKVYVE